MNPLVPNTKTREVSHSLELTRVLQIPRRIWDEDEARSLAYEMSRILRRPGSLAELRPIQAQSLYDAGTEGGGFFPIRVGGGKTLITLLLPLVLGLRRPLILLKANLLRKTENELRILAADWHIPNYSRFISYELLGRPQSAQMLDAYQPDGFISDECHRLKNPKAAVVKRVDRYMRQHPETSFSALSGTITKRSIKDFAHILKWIMRPLMLPIPNGYHEIQDWADALDEKPNGQNIEIGALVLLQNAEERKESDQISATRKALRRRIVETPGVVGTTEGFTGSSLIIEARECKMNQATDDAFSTLWELAETPCGIPFADPMSIWRCARELSLGFYYRWDPQPPISWLAPRKDWYAWCRYILGHNHRNLDSEYQVTQAVLKGLYPEALGSLTKWRAVEDSFVPNTVPVWIDESVIESCAAWAAEAPGLVWCEHIAFAEKLAKRANLSYYGRGGVDQATKRTIEEHPPVESIICSVASNCEGRNLQAWSRNLIVSCPPNGLQWEQLMARTHRDNQMADEVTFDVFLTSVAHANALFQAMRDAKHNEDSTGQSQKILYADLVYPSPDEIAGRMGPRWNK